MTTWSATATYDSRWGQAATAVAAWQAAAAAALDLAGATSPHESITIEVGGAAASFYPGWDRDGNLDLAATRAAAAELVAEHSAA
ncbi:MAG: hypothetical protein AB7I38_11855 [Dehalococcoidia bacterium]